jgi:hypothetical protein
VNAAVFVGRLDDLREFGARADVPARFYGLYEGNLDFTASAEGKDGLDACLANHHVVGLDTELLRSKSEDAPREVRYRRNLAQKLAARRVVGLWVLRSIEPGEARTTWVFNRTPNSRMAEVSVTFVASKVTLGGLIDLLRGYGLWLRVEACGAGQRLVLAWSDGTELARPRESGYELLGLFDLNTENKSLVSRMLDARSWGPETPLLSIAQDMRVSEEARRLRDLTQIMVQVRDSMQVGTRQRGSLELVVVATRALRASDHVVLDAALKSSEGLKSEVRIWLMAETLRAGADLQTRVTAKYVWPDAVSFLLARLVHVPIAEDRTQGGVYAWRSIGFGPRFDVQEMERLRDAAMQRILEDTSTPSQPPKLEPTGPLTPLKKGVATPNRVLTALAWGEGQHDRIVGQLTAERVWVTDYQHFGAQLAQQRARLAQAANSTNTPDSGAIDHRDPEGAYARTFWQQVRTSPGVLRTLANGQNFRAQRPFVDWMKSQLTTWNEDVLASRRTLARSREQALQQAEEVERARRFHLSLGWRVGIATSVAIFAGYLSLSLLNVLTTLSAGAWITGAWIVLAAFVGAWCGALLPMWLERKAGERASTSVDGAQTAVHEDHCTTSASTYDLMVDADHLRQELRKAAIQNRTAQLANRAWTIVKSTRQAVAEEIAKQKLITQPELLIDQHERLSSEDRHNWRTNALIRPEGILQRSAYQSGSTKTTSAWDEAVAEVQLEFNHAWRSGLEAEDRYSNGFLRKHVLEQLVRNLSHDVVRKLQDHLLSIANAACESGGVYHEGRKLTADVWHELMQARIGSWLSQALLSASDDQANVEAAGQVHYIHRAGSSLCENLRSRLADIQPLACPVADEYPMALFGFAFESVPMEFSTGPDGRLVIHRVAPARLLDSEVAGESA